MEYYVGQIVRLKRGWTPLQIIQIKGDTIKAKYCGEGYWHGVTLEDLKNPQYAESYQRRQRGDKYGFVLWDKSLKGLTHNRAAYNNYLIQWEKDNMKQFMLRSVCSNRGHTDIIGTQIGTTSNKDIVLEFSNGMVEVHPMGNLREFKQRAVKLRNVKNNQIYTFLVKAEADFEHNRYVISNRGDIYVVEDTDFDYSYTPKTWFEGDKLVTQPL